MNIENISQVNEKYIFTVTDGIHDRFEATLELLKKAQKDIIEENCHLNFMWLRIQKKADYYQTVIEDTKAAIKTTEYYINSHQELPIVERGLSEQHDTLMQLEEKLKEYRHYLNVCNALTTECDVSRQHYKQLYNEIVAAIRCYI